MTTMQRTKSSFGMCILVLALAGVAAVGYVLAPGVSVQERYDGHANIKHGTEAIEAIQDGWTSRTVEVYISIQRQSAAVAYRDPDKIRLSFVSIRDRLGMAGSMLKIKPTWAAIEVLVNGSLEMTHYVMSTPRWERTQRRDGYIQVWPVWKGQGSW